jgi:murein DD-endopeptidase MepM/ murein hydrolase activator NlpD
MNVRAWVVVGVVATVMLQPVDPSAPPVSAPLPMPVRAAVVSSADIFQYPLPTWAPHCLGFGSQWRYCNGTPLRVCPSSGAVWLHTGVDIRTGIQPVMAAGDGVIVGYTIDPVFHGGVLIGHRTSFGAFITQYWHVWLRPGFGVGTPVKRGEAFADIASMGDRTHLHFAVFVGGYQPYAFVGALPPGGCEGYPAFPYRFADPTAFIETHLQVVALPRGTRTDS